MRRSRYDEFLEMQAQETDDCILWPYACNQYGYGQVRRDGWAQLVHRLSCTIAYRSPLPGKNYALHSCRNKNCFNPRHLRWGSQKENMADCVGDGTVNRGTRNGAAKIDEATVRLIRQESASGVLQKDIAEKFGLSRTGVSGIVTRRIWNWIDPDHTPREIPRAG